jgi:hypothetical protein
MYYLAKDVLAKYVLAIIVLAKDVLAIMVIAKDVDCGLQLLPSAKLYTNSTAEIKLNHPLMIMVEHGRAVSSRGQRYDFLNIFAKYSENTKTTEL